MVKLSNVTLREDVKKHIEKITSPDQIYTLFKLLNYPKGVFFDSSFKRKKDSFDFKKEDKERIKQIYPVLSFGEKLKKGDKLPVFLIESSTLTPSFIRSITRKFSEMYLRFLLIVTVDYEEIVVVFPDYEKLEAGKHKLKITKLIINKKEIYYTDVETLSNICFEGNEDSWRVVWKKWKKAFSVERVTKNFFDDYKNMFFNLRKKLDKQGVSKKESHEFTLQFLNRIMFIYFISKKKWLGKPKFMEWFWKSYLIEKNKGNIEKDTFYEKWLKQVFFKAFNNRNDEITDLPEDVKKVFSGFPFLNGGLFTKNGIDEITLKINDALFKEIFEFFEKYNFTIKEDMPLESSVAVDPQMIGYVYESLANVAEEIYDRTDMGIFYTQRIEVHFMCGRSLVEYLSKQMTDIPKEKFYHLIFDLPEEKEKIEKYFEKEGLWERLEENLDNLSIVDPACGSGAFLVGMLNILADIYNMIYKHRRASLTDFELKTRITGRSIYGVDVMPWAIHAAELRLWLQLIVETEFKKEELRRHPLLPNLNMNLRIGDSLVQEVGGINLHLRDSNISDKLKKKLSILKNEKEKFSNNNPTAKFKTPSGLREEEIRIFEEIIDERIHNIEKDKKELEGKISKLQKTKQKNLLGEISEEKQKKIIDEREKKEKILERLITDFDELNKIKESLENPEKKPFVWDIDFAEVFGDKNGFDIVIGNPPYVRQEKISPPNKLKAEVTLADRREYKDKLIKSVNAHLPVVKKINKQSDYYVYFYFHGLSLLNEKGTFCFITSNSWLDVGYGKELQEFLLKYVPVIAIYDNPKRSFAHADINTIIALFGAPQFGDNKEWWKRFNGEWSALHEIAKFVMFKKPFEEVLSSQNLIDIENVTVETRGDEITDLLENVVKTNDYRIFPMIQEDLLEDGWEYPENHDSKKNGKFKKGGYAGNKWGGKYLRAPDIFYTILEKGNDKLVELGKIAKVTRGFTTGANEFFYLDEEAQKKWKIEEEFLMPLIKSPRECKKIVVEPNQLKYMVFICDKNKQELEGTNALKYINWGENQEIEIKGGGDKGKKVKGYNNLETLKNRNLWYSLSCNLGNAFWIKETNDRLGCFITKKDMICDCRLYYVKLSPAIQNFSNSTIMALFSEVLSRSGLGAGAKSLMVYEVNKFLVMKVKKLNNNFLLKNRKLRSIFDECGVDPEKPIREQKPKPLSDRAKLDNIIFDELNLTEKERDEVYFAVCEMVKSRLSKARSLKTM